MDKDFVRRLFIYKRGVLFWRNRPPEDFKRVNAYKMWNKRYAGKPAGSVGGKGYIRIAIYKKYYMAHRLVWLYHHGVFPEMIDHKNGKKADNRISNLRAVICSQNLWNAKRYHSTKTNIKGVYERKKGVYEAHVCANGKRTYLGRFTSKKAAAGAVRAARELLHGEYARHG